MLLCWPYLPKEKWPRQRLKPYLDHWCWMMSTTSGTLLEMGERRNRYETATNVFQQSYAPHSIAQVVKISQRRRILFQATKKSMIAYAAPEVIPWEAKAADNVFFTRDGEEAPLFFTFYRKKGSWLSYRKHHLFYSLCMAGDMMVLLGIWLAWLACKTEYPSIPLAMVWVYCKCKLGCGMDHRSLQQMPVWVNC